MEEIKMEMSTLNDCLPRYYKGFDMDGLIKKMRNNEPLTEKERYAINEAQEIYFEKRFEENQKRWDAWAKEHPGEYRTHIDHSMIERPGD